MSQSEIGKDIEYFRGLEYPIHLTKRTDNGEEYWLAEILDLPGCMADGETPNDALDSLEEAKQLWIASHFEDGYEVPEPSDPFEYSGRLVLRMPKSLHRRLALEAKREGVSLNQHMISQLAARIGASESYAYALAQLVSQTQVNVTNNFVMQPPVVPQHMEPEESLRAGTSVSELGKEGDVNASLIGDRLETPFTAWLNEFRRRRQTSGARTRPITRRSRSEEV